MFISGLKSDDPYYVEAKAFFKSQEDNEIQAETSVLTLLEVAAVSGRLYETKKGKRDEKGRKVFIVGMLRKLAGIRPKFINILGDTPESIKGIQANLPSVFNEAILKSAKYAQDAGPHSSCSG